jgi:superfamily I DNA/RNA helicase
VLVDEYQDVNPGQVGLIDHFVNDGVRLWAVGDDDQTLYAFRASDVRYILEFTKKYLAATVHVLDRNYRSCPNIVLAAKRLIRHNRIRSDKDYQPALAEVRYQPRSHFACAATLRAETNDSGGHDRPTWTSFIFNALNDFREQMPPLSAGSDGVHQASAFS